MPAEVSTEILDVGFRVLRIFGENTKIMKAFDIPLDPVMTKIGGKNGNGKTSAIDCLRWALGGKKAIDEDPIRHGQTKGVAGTEIVSRSGRYIITQRLRAGKDPELKIETVEGAPPDTTPQAFLNGLHGVLNFDAEEFTRMGGAERLKVMTGLVRIGIDLKQHKIAYDALYQSRRDIGRDLDKERGALAKMPAPAANAPTEAIDVAALVEEKNALDGVIRSNAGKRSDLRQAQEVLKVQQREIENCEQEIARLQKRLAAFQENAASQHSECERLRAEVAGLVDPDTSEIDAKIADANRLNNLALSAAQYRRTEKAVHELQAAYDAATNRLEEMDKEKEDALEAATFPVPGLSFADGDVSYNGTLFDQIGKANQIKVSFAIAMALNPKLRTVVVANGSLLDEDAQADVYRMAQEAGFQAVLEVVGNAPGANIIIQNGEVVTNCRAN